jgi:hypothetical protein
MVKYRPTASLAGWPARIVGVFTCPRQRKTSLGRTVPNAKKQTRPGAGSRPAIWLLIAY